MTDRKRFLFLLVILISLLLLVMTGTCAFANIQRAARERSYLDEAKLAATAFDVPFPLVLAVMRVESDFRPDAISNAGAIGLMQLMPSTFLYLRDEILHETWEDDAIFDPAVNIRYGVCYLAYLRDRFPDWKTALAAYNAGEGNVREWLLDSELSPDGVLQTIPFPETARYVEKTWNEYQNYSRKYKSD